MSFSNVLAAILLSRPHKVGKSSIFWNREEKKIHDESQKDKMA